MATVKAIPEPLTGDPELDEEIANFEKRGNWVEDRKEILKNLTGAEIDAMIERLEAEHPERLLTPEQVEALRTEEARPIPCHAEPLFAFTRFADTLNFRRNVVSKREAGLGALTV